MSSVRGYLFTCFYLGGAAREGNPRPLPDALRSSPEHANASVGVARPPSCTFDVTIGIEAVESGLPKGPNERDP